MKPFVVCICPLFDCHFLVRIFYMICSSAVLRMQAGCKWQAGVLSEDAGRAVRSRILPIARSGLHIAWFNDLLLLLQQRQVWGVICNTKPNQDRQIGLFAYSIALRRLQRVKLFSFCEASIYCTEEVLKNQTPSSTRYSNKTSPVKFAL